MLQLAFTGRQPVTDLPQRAGSSKLAKHHGDELSPTGKASRMAFRLMLLDGLLELASGEQLEKLSKNG